MARKAKTDVEQPSEFEKDLNDAKFDPEKNAQEVRGTTDDHGGRRHSAWPRSRASLSRSEGCECAKCMV